MILDPSNCDLAGSRRQKKMQILKRDASRIGNEQASKKKRQRPPQLPVQPVNKTTCRKCKRRHDKIHVSWFKMYDQVHAYEIQKHGTEHEGVSMVEFTNNEQSKNGDRK